MEIKLERVEIPGDGIQAFRVVMDQSQGSQPDLTPSTPELSETGKRFRDQILGLLR